MEKQQFIEYVNNLIQIATSKPQGKDDIEKARDSIRIKTATAKLSALYKTALKSMTKEQVDQSINTFPEVRHPYFRNNLIAGVRTKLNSENPNYGKTNPVFHAFAMDQTYADYDRYKDIIGKHITKEEFDKQFNAEPNKDYPGFYSRNDMNRLLSRMLKKKGVGEEEIDSISDALHDKQIPSMDEIKDSLAGLIDEKEFETNPRLSPAGNVPEMDKHNSPAYTQFLADNIEPQKLDELVEVAEKENYSITKPIDEISVQRYPEQTKKLREGGVTKEQEDALKYIEDNYKTANTKFNNDIENYRGTFESATYHVNKHAADAINKANGLEDAVTIDMVQKGTNISTYNVFDKTKPEKMQEFNNADLSFTPETKKALIDTLHKMENNGYYSGGLMLEQGEKVYGLSKLYDIQNDIYTAMNGSVDEGKTAEEREKYKNQLPELTQKHKEETEKIKDIYADIKKVFPVTDDNLSYPGNVDVARNTNFPPEIRRDIATTSTFNGLYGVLSFIKGNNITIEEFVESPRKYLMQANAKIIDSVNPSSDINKDKSVGDLIFSMQADETAIGIDPKTMTALGRVMESLTNIEKDPEQRVKNYAVGELFMKNTSALDSVMSNRKSYQKNKKLFSRIMLVNEKENRDYSLTGEPVYDGKNLEIKPAKPFDEAEYMLKNEISLKEFDDKIKNSLGEYDRKIKEAKQKYGISGKPSFNTNDFLNVAQITAQKLMIAKIEQKGTPEYEQLRLLAEDPKEYAKQVMQEKNFSIDGFDKMNFAQSKGFDAKAEAEINNLIKSSKNFGREIINADVALNKTLKTTQKEIDKLNKDIEKAKQKNKDTKDLEKRKAEKEKLLDDKINTRKQSLEKDFRDGKITEHYYKERLNQFENKKFDSVPPMFLADKMPSKKEYLNNADLQDLTDEEKDLVYNNAVERANQAKKDFFKKQYLRDKDYIPKEPNYTMEEMNPELKNAGRISSADIKTVTADDLKKAQEANKATKDNELGERIHVDIEEKEEIKTKMIKSDGKTKEINRQINND